MALAVALTLCMIGVLVLCNRPSLVELRLRASRVTFATGPSDRARRLPALRGARLFSRSLRLTELGLENVARLAVAVEGRGLLSLQPDAGGQGASLALKAVDDAKPFTPDLSLLAPADLTFEAGSGGRVRIGLGQEAGAASQETLWQGRIGTGTGIDLHLGQAEARDAGGHVLPLPSPLALARSSVPVALTGDHRRAGIAFRLAPPEESTQAVVFDPETGEPEAMSRLELPLTETRLMAWREGLVFFGKVKAWTLLQPDLRLYRLDLTRWMELEPTSGLLGGTVRFPGGEKGSLRLERGFFLTLEPRPRHPLTLRSLDLVGDHLELVVWGVPQSLKVGPTFDALSERLPSYFEWVYTNRLSALIYTSLAWVAGVFVAALNFRKSLRE